MTEKEKRVKLLENENAEIAKEILLNESAIYETQKEISGIETELLADLKIQKPCTIFTFVD